MELQKNIGSFFETDANGYIINPTSFTKIQGKWRGPLDEVRGEYLSHFGTALHSLYLRGSVAKGEALEELSDIDTFAVVDLDEEEIDVSWWRELNQSIRENYSFVEGVEVVAIPLKKIDEFPGDKIMIKTQSICLYGIDLSETIPPYKPGPDTVQHAQGIGREIANTIIWLQEDKSEEKVMNKCSWIMKRIVRSGCELVMGRSGKYTRDLYPCYEVFSDFYPEKKDEMYEALNLSISPTSDKQTILRVLTALGNWITEEVDRYLQLHSSL
jgi:hypothetical protein